VVGLAFPVGVLGGEIAKAYAIYTAVVHSHEEAMRAAAEGSEVEGAEGDGERKGGDENKDGEVGGTGSVGASKGLVMAGSAGLCSTDIFINLSTQEQIRSQRQSLADICGGGSNNEGRRRGVGSYRDLDLDRRPLLDETMLRDIVQQAVTASVTAMVQQQQLQLRELKQQPQPQADALPMATADDPGRTSVASLILAPRRLSTSHVETTGTGADVGSSRLVGRRGSGVGSATRQSFIPGDAKERAYGEYYAKVSGSDCVC